MHIKQIRQCAWTALIPSVMCTEELNAKVCGEKKNAPIKVICIDLLHC